MTGGAGCSTSSTSPGAVVRLRRVP